MKAFLVSLAMFFSCAPGLATFPRFGDKLGEAPLRVCLRQYDQQLECCMYMSAEKNLCAIKCLSDEGTEEIKPCR